MWFDFDLLVNAKMASEKVWSVVSVMYRSWYGYGSVLILGGGDV